MKWIPAFLFLSMPLLADGVVWEKDFETARKRAQAEHKVILLDLWAEWCGPCQALRRNVFPDPKAQAALRKAVPLEVMVEHRDRTQDQQGISLANRYGLRAFPSLYVLDAEGNVLRSHAGYLSAEDLARFVEGK